MISKPFRRMIALALPFLFGATLWFFYAAPLIDQIAYDREGASEAKAMIARYRMIEARLPSARSAAMKLQDGADDGSFMTKADPALLASVMQEGAQTIVNHAGGVLRTSRTLPPAQEGGFERVGVEVAFSVTASDVMRFLYAVELARPKLLVDHVSIRVSESGSIRDETDNKQPYVEVVARLASYVKAQRIGSAK